MSSIYSCIVFFLSKYQIPFTHINIFLLLKISSIFLLIQTNFPPPPHPYVLNDGLLLYPTAPKIFDVVYTGCPRTQGTYFASTFLIKNGIENSNTKNLSGVRLTSREGEITCTEVGFSHSLASGTCIPAHRIRFSDWSYLIVNSIFFKCLPIT